MQKETRIKFSVQQNEEGKLLVAETEILQGEEVLIFEGITVDRFDCLLFDEDPHQIDEDSYLIIKGDGKYCRHSCNPNAYLDSPYSLRAMRNINAGEEICFDYSTCMADGAFFLCNCGHVECRKLIEDFEYLPRTLQDYYISRSAVPQFIVKSLSEELLERE